MPSSVIDTFPEQSSPSTLSEADLRALQDAKNVLENPGLTAQITNLIGSPIEAVLKRLPAGFHRKLSGALEAAMLKLADTVTYTIKDAPTHDATGAEAGGSHARPANTLHTLGVMVSGGIGGFFGPWAMLAEVPVTTGIIFRSIADIARSQGEQVSDMTTRMACIEVFALGGKSAEDDATESGYYAARAALAQQVRAASDFLAKGAHDKSAPVLLALVRKVAERLGVQYTEKLGAQLLPVIGAAGGAAINTIFIRHFQAMAKGHFAVRRLERKYGKDMVEATYRALPMRG
jgi:hypothetical protein